MPPRVNEALAYSKGREGEGGEVLVEGGLGLPNRLKGVAAFVWQESSEEKGVAVAAAMTMHSGSDGRDDTATYLASEGERWLLILKQVSTEDFSPGRAYALVAALYVDQKDPRKEQWDTWYLPVQLLDDPKRIQQARTDIQKALHLSPLSATQ